MDRLCKARRLSISQIQKYLFPIQVSPVHQVLGTPPMKDCAPEKAQGNFCIHLWHCLKLVLQLFNRIIIN